MCQQLYGAAHRQTHDGVVVALNTVQPEGRPSLNGIGTGFIVGFGGGSVEVDLLFTQREESNAAAVHKKLSVRVTVRDAHAGVHLVGGTGKGAQHPLCVLCFAVGLPNTLAVHIHHRVAADDHSARVLGRNSKALAPGQLFHQMGRGVAACTVLSSKSLTQTVKSVVYRESSSRLRGLPEAKIRFIFHFSVFPLYFR